MTMFNGNRPQFPESIWKTYQAQYQKTAARKRRLKKGMRLALLFAVGIAVIYCIIWSYDGISWDWGASPNKAAAKLAIEGSESGNKPQTNKAFVRRLLADHPVMNLPQQRFDVTREGRAMTVVTSIHPGLQNYLLEKLDRRNSRYIGIVALEPSSGKIVMMTGFNRHNPNHNTCVDNQYPAASIFKIVTAAAAVEQKGLVAGSKLKYNGSQETLYKSQLKEKTNRYTNHTTLRDSFAKSINPVFGKIGTLYLQKEILDQYAEAFGFNQEIDFEIPVQPGRIDISDEPYHWAEIASGFNRQTTLSPLHGAMLAATIVNQGNLIQPSIVDQITGETGEIIYQSRMPVMKRVVLPSTTRILYDLMEATVRYGTSRKAFRGYQKDEVLSKLNIGGKTGSIYNRSHEVKYDWFVGFADLKNGDQKLAVAVVVAHEKYIGIRAGKYAYLVMKKYFVDLL